MKSLPGKHCSPAGQREASCGQGALRTGRGPRESSTAPPREILQPEAVGSKPL